jgi:hypothetical protein
VLSSEGDRPSVWAVVGSLVVGEIICGSGVLGSTRTILRKHCLSRPILGRGGG